MGTPLSDTRCPKCGARLPGGSGRGPCPACLLGIGLDAVDTAGGEEGGGTLDPTVEGPPRHFGGFELEREVARGGMGVVYRARQTALARTVALKMIRAGSLASREAVHRFHIEAAAVARLEHPNIVPLHEFGEHEGVHYLCLKWIGGGSLADLARAGRLPGRRAAEIVSAVARAVAHAHERGVLHRDLKPGNILRDDAGTPYVTDFGLARLAEDAPGATRAGAVLGSPAYMSPEQAAGRPGEVTVASDIYGLGAVLYELLTGRAPFEGPTPVEVLRRVLHDAPARPRALVPGVDRDLEVIALKCLEKEPGRRYRTAAELADDLDRWASGRPILARPVGRLERATMWARRRPAVAFLSLATACSLVFGMGGIVWQWRAARSALAKAEASEREARSASAPVMEAAQALEPGYPGRWSLLASAPGALVGPRKLEEPAGLGAWSLESGALVHDFAGLEGTVSRAALSRDGDRIATMTVASHPFWRTCGRTAQSWHEFHVGKVFGTGVAPGTGGLGEPIEIWETGSGRRLATLRTRPTDAPVLVLALSPDASMLATGHRNGAVELWDVAKAAHLRSLTRQDTAVQWVEFSRDGMRLVSCAAGWDEVRVGTRIRHDPVIARVHQTADGKVVGTLWNRVAFWRVFGQEATAERVRATFHPDGTHVVVWAGHRENVGVWDIARGRRLGGGDARGPEVLSAAYSGDGRWVALARADGEVEILDGTTGLEHRRLRGHRRAVDLAVFAPDSRRLLTGSRDLDLRLWDVEEGIGLSVLRGHAGREANAVFVDAMSVVSTATDGSVRRWRVLTEDQAAPRLSGHRRRITGLVFTPDGRGLLSASEDASVRCWDVETGRSRHVWEGGNRELAAEDRALLAGPMRDLALVGASPGCVAAGDEPAARQYRGIWPFGTEEVLPYRPVRVWDWQTGEERHAFDVGPRGASRVFVAPGGRRLAVLEGDFVRTALVGVSGRGFRTEVAPAPDVGRPKLRVFDAESGKALGRIQGFASPYEDRVAFSPDGSWLVVAWPRELRVYDVKSAEGGVPESVPPLEPEKVLPGGEGDEFGAVRFEAAKGGPEAGRAVRLLARRGASHVDVWDPEGWRRAASLDFGPERVVRGWLRGDGGEMLTWLESGVLTRRDVATGASKGTVQGLRREYWNLALSADGRVFVAGQYDRQVCAVDVETGTMLGRYDGHLSRVTAVAISRDGRRMASGDEEGLVRLWTVPAVR